MNTQRPYKHLPDGSPSYLSLNDLKVFGLPAMLPYDGYLGKQIYSHRTISEVLCNILLPVQPDLQPEAAFSTLHRLVNDGLHNKPVELAIAEVAQRILAVPLALHRLDAQLIRENSCFSTADIAFWRQCKSVYCFGVLAQGQLGIRINNHIEAMLHCLGNDPFRVQLVAVPITPSLLGIAKHIESMGKRQGLLFDFGHSRIKRGMLCAGEGRASAMEMASIPTPNAPTDGQADPNWLHNMIMQTLLGAYDEAVHVYGTYAAEAHIAIANNIWNGQIANRGFYGALSALNATDYGSYLAETMTNHTGMQWRIALYNDADAVALLIRRSDAAVITLGTNLGIAYPRSAQSCASFTTQPPHAILS
ncbi:MAG: hypothetical protein LBN04_09290 [Oscillospiraceae bacterium]|jgi:hypothetical protein|nr:hypothetical protein [Oscillospiraceae bacterium]